MRLLGIHIFGMTLALLLFVGSAQAKDEVDILSEEMLSFDAADENNAQNTEENKSAGLFGFVKKFFGGKDTFTGSSGDKESFLDKNIRLAEEGDVEAQLNLGYMYLYGENGAPKDFEKAVKYYTIASQQNNPIALNNLGSLYFNGIGVDKDGRMALELFQKSADLGNENAAINLAFINLAGGKKDGARNLKAVKLFESAAEKSSIAKFMLGYAYYRGFVVPQNYEKAFTLIKSAADGNAKIDEAQLVLADMYRYGKGTVQNYQSAILEYRAAVLQGNIDSIMTLAEVYAEGKICMTNLPLAHALLNIAASRNVPNAAELREKLVQETNMNLEMLTKAQTIAREYKPEVSELTGYIRQTYGTSIRSYIDNNIPDLITENQDEQKQ